MTPCEGCKKRKAYLVSLITAIVLAIRNIFSRRDVWGNKEGDEQ